MARISITSPSPFAIGVHPVSLGDQITVDQDVADRYIAAGLAVAVSDSKAAPRPKASKAATPADGATNTTTEPV
jgi:hypothetical protein